MADGHVWVPHRGSSLQAPEEAAIYSWLTPHNAWLRSAREARGYFGTWRFFTQTEGGGEARDAEDQAFDCLRTYELFGAHQRWQLCRAAVR